MVQVDSESHENLVEHSTDQEKLHHFIYFFSSLEPKFFFPHFNNFLSFSFKLNLIHTNVKFSYKNNIKASHKLFKL
jgi:hypothetical protein